MSICSEKLRKTASRKEEDVRNPGTAITSRLMISQPQFPTRKGRNPRNHNCPCRSLISKDRNFLIFRVESGLESEIPTNEATVFRYFPGEK
jgi:hypothetical protein